MLCAVTRKLGRTKYQRPRQALRFDANSHTLDGKPYSTMAPCWPRNNYSRHFEALSSPPPKKPRAPRAEGVGREENRNRIGLHALVSIGWTAR